MAMTDATLPLLTPSGGSASTGVKPAALPAFRNLPRLLLYLGVCLVTRGGIFGDWNYECDDQFYALVGQRLLHGATLYVDIWDRKGPLLYLIYAGVAWLSRSVIAYQLAALLATVWGGWSIAGIAQRLTDARAGTCAGLAWCLLVLPLGGSNGQSEIFYEPLMIAAAASLLAEHERLAQGRLSLRLIAGFACAGLAITCKQAAAIEVGFFGLVALAIQLRGSAGLGRTLINTTALAFIAALPLALCAGWYWHAGHFDALWQALVTSNLHRGYMPTDERWHRLLTATMLLAVPLGFAVLGAINLRKTVLRDELAFVLVWCLVAIGAILAYPNIYSHYLLTALPPLCVLASGLYRQGKLGLIALAGLALTVLPATGAVKWADRARSRQASQELVAYLRQVTPDHRLLVWGFPSYLYALTSSPPPSPLAFPPHLFDASEAHATGRDQAKDVARILAGRPETVVVQDPLPSSPLNAASVALVQRYTGSCRNLRNFTLYDSAGPQVQKVFSDCAGG